MDVVNVNHSVHADRKKGRRWDSWGGGGGAVRAMCAYV